MSRRGAGGKLPGAGSVQAPVHDQGQSAGFTSLYYRNFRLLWSGALVSNIGTWLQAVAQGWLVLQLTNSAFMLGLVSAAGTLPVLLFSLYGGVLADRGDRRVLLIVAEIGLMVFTLLMALLTVTHLITIYWLLALVLCIGLASSLSSPAWMAFIGELVPSEALLNAIALNSAQFNVARVLGPALAGTLIVLIGTAGCFTLNGLSFLAVIVALAAIRAPARMQPVSRPSSWSSMVEALRYVAGHAEARAVLTLATIHTVFGMPFLMLMPVFARSVFHGNAGDLGILLSGMGAGAVGGALLTARFGGVGRRGLVILGMELAFALALVVFARMPNLLFGVPALALVGFWMVSFFAVANTTVQILCDERLRGRIMALWTIASWGITPLGSLWAGALAARAGASATCTIGGCICLLAVAGMAAGSPLLRLL